MRMWALSLVFGICILVGAESDEEATPEPKWKTPNIVNYNHRWTKVREPFFREGDKRPNPPQQDFLAARNTSSIIVLIASYRETRVVATIESVFASAAHPDRVLVGVVQQNAKEDEDALEQVCERRGTPLTRKQPELDTHVRLPEEHPYGHERYTDESLEACSIAKQIRIFRMDYLEAKGPVFARAQQPRLLSPGDDVEDFCMQIDAHTIFLKSWDVRMIEDWCKTENEYAVLTSYPTGLNQIKDVNEPPNTNGHWEMPHMCKAAIMSPGVVRNTQAGAAANLDKPVLSKLWAAGLSFSRCHAETDVPSDPFLKQIFTGEEFSRGSRLWTNGYDFYSMTRPIIGTYYGGEKGNKGTWRSNIAEKRVAEKRLARLLRHDQTLAQDAASNFDVSEYLQGYDLGNRRRFEDYIALTGVDTIKNVYQETHCRVDRWVPWEEGATEPYLALPGRPGKLPPLDLPPGVLEDLSKKMDAADLVERENREIPINMVPTTPRPISATPRPETVAPMEQPAAPNLRMREVETERRQLPQDVTGRAPPMKSSGRFGANLMALILILGSIVAIFYYVMTKHRVTLKEN